MDILGILIFIGVIVILIIGFYFTWYLHFYIYHKRHPDLPRLNRRMLHDHLIGKYGKKEGKKLFKRFADAFKHDYGIK